MLGGWIYLKCGGMGTRTFEVLQKRVVFVFICIWLMSPFQILSRANAQELESSTDQNERSLTPEQTQEEIKTALTTAIHHGDAEAILEIHKNIKPLNTGDLELFNHFHGTPHRAFLKAFLREDPRYGRCYSRLAESPEGLAAFYALIELGALRMPLSMNPAYEQSDQALDVIRQVWAEIKVVSDRISSLKEDFGMDVTFELKTREQLVNLLFRILDDHGSIQFIIPYSHFALSFRDDLPLAHPIFNRVVKDLHYSPSDEFTFALIKRFLDLGADPWLDSVDTFRFDSVFQSIDFAIKEENRNIENLELINEDRLHHNKHAIEEAQERIAPACFW